MFSAATRKHTMVGKNILRRSKRAFGGDMLNKNSGGKIAAKARGSP